MTSVPQDPRAYRRRWIAWALYDVANSSFFLVIVTAVFPLYFQSIYAAAHGDPTNTGLLQKGGAALAFTATVAMAVVAVLGPVLGAVADRSASKKRFLAGFAGLGVLATAAMVFVGPTDWRLAAVLYALGTIGVAGSMVFYDALLPAVAREDDIDRVSSVGFAAGYLGSVVLFVGIVVLIGLGWPSKAWATRLSFGAVALWWAVFTLPVLRSVPEPAVDNPGRASVLDGFRQLASTFRKAARYRELLLFLLAFWVYSDGIGTIIKLAAPFGKTLGVPDEKLLYAIILSNLIGVPCALGFGWLAKRAGAKRAILLGLAVYASICVYARFMRSAGDFFILAAAVGLVQGGTQALSRALFATLVPKGQTGEFFGFFSAMEKFAGLLGPLILGLYWSDKDGDPRRGVFAIIVFFVVGFVLLSFVDPAKGRAEAQT